MGMASKGAMTSCMALSSFDSLIWDVPDNWTLEEAATVPVVYGTVRSLRTLVAYSKNK